MNANPKALYFVGKNFQDDEFLGHSIHESIADCFSDCNEESSCNYISYNAHQSICYMFHVYPNPYGYNTCSDQFPYPDQNAWLDGFRSSQARCGNECK